MNSGRHHVTPLSGVSGGTTQSYDRMLLYHSVRPVLTRQDMTILRCLAFTILFVASAVEACAQVFPSKPLTIIVPFAAGGPSDAMSRILGERMKASLGQPILVENVTGAGGSVGVGRAV